MPKQLIALLVGMSVFSFTVPLAAEEYCYQSNTLCLDYETQPTTVVWNGVGDLNDVARRACIKMFGGASNLESINKAQRVVLCRTSQGRYLDKLRLRISNKKKDQQPSAKDSSIPSADRDETEKCLDEACNDIEPPKLGPPAKSSEGSQQLQEQAREFCVKKLGPTASVEHMDFRNWQITCKR